MARRIAGTVIALIGVTLVVYTLSIHFLGAASAWERMSKDFKPIFTEQAIAQARTDLAGLQAVGTEFGTKATTVLGTALNQTPAEVVATFAAQFPNTAAAIIALPDIAQRLQQNATVIATERARFVRADNTPSSSMPSTSIPWFIISIGIAAIIAGIAMQVSLRAAPVLAAVVGVVMIAVPLAYSLPSKAQNADTLNDHLRPVLTAANTAQTQTDIATLTAMATELQNKLVPVLAAALKVPPAQVQSFVASNFPTLAAALPQIPVALGRLSEDSAIAAGNLDEFRAVQAVKYLPVAWLTIGAGIVTLAYAGWALAMTDTGAGTTWQARRAARKAKRAA